MRKESRDSYGYRRNRRYGSACQKLLDRIDNKDLALFSGHFPNMAMTTLGAHLAAKTKRLPSSPILPISEFSWQVLSDRHGLPMRWRAD
jgi:hypothetical protein